MTNFSILGKQKQRISADPCLQGGARPEKDQYGKTFSQRLTLKILQHRSENGLLGSPSHAVSLFWRLRFGKPWRQAMLVPCPEGSVVGKSFQSEVEVRLKAKSRCEMRPEVSPEAAKIVSFLKVPAATFDTEDHPSTGQKTSFLNSPGHAVALFWRLRFGKPCLFYRFRPQRLTLKITSAQVSEVSPAAAQIVSFLAVPAATFDTEDHPSTGRKTVSLSSPDHAVSLFRRQPFWEGFWVRSRGFAGRDTQTQPKVQTVHLQAKSWCELSPIAAKPPFFKDSGRDVWHWRSLQRRSKNGVIELARPCCFPVPEAAFLGRLLGQKSWFCRSWYPNATEGANGVFRRQLEVQIAPQSCKTFFFYRFRPQRLTLKITPAQVEKRCHWARQAMLFPCSGGSLFGKAFGSEVVVLPVVISKRNRRCQRCISKAIGGANCTPKLQNLLFLSVPGAAFDIEDHPSTGLGSKSCSGTNRLFFSGSGRNVWHWRSPQHRSKSGLLQLARPCCFAVLEAAFWEALTPGHAVSLSRRKRCWEVFPVRSRGASQS